MSRPETAHRAKLRISFIGVALIVALLLSFTHDPRLTADRGISDPIFDRDVVAYSIHGNGSSAVVQYQYAGDVLPQKLDPHEVVRLRTESSFTRVSGATPRGEPVYELVAYSTDKAFVHKDGVWYTRETGHTSLALFNRARARNPVASLLWEEVHADSVSPFSTAGDGYVEAEDFTSGFFGDCGINQGWNNAHDSTSGNVANYTSTTMLVYSYKSFAQDSDLDTCNSDGIIYRAFTPFDTSAIPSGSTISAVTLNLYASSKSNGDNDGDDFITVIQTDHGGHTTLSVLDYDNVGATNNPTEAVDTGERKDITSISTAAYTVFTLNATGRGYVKTSGQSSTCSATNGITCLGLREGHDVLDSPVQSDTVSAVDFYTSERTGTSEDPYLSVTYTAPASAPTVTTSAATSVTAASATANGDVTATGGSSATTCGFAWGTVSTLRGGDTATTTDSTCPGSTGAFTKSLTSLSQGTTYYFKAYATNVTGTGYGTIQSFTTLSTPQITTSAATAVSPSGGVLNAAVTGGESATTCGFAWGTVSTLRGGDTATTTDSGCPSIGTFSRVLTGLNALTTYYFRAYGTGASTGYGTILSFTTDTTTPARVMRLFGNVRLGGVRLLGL